MYLYLLYFLPLAYQHFIFIMITRILHNQGLLLHLSPLEEISCVHLVGIIFIASSLPITTKLLSVTVLFLTCKGTVLQSLYFYVFPLS